MSDTHRWRFASIGTRGGVKSDNSISQSAEAPAAKERAFHRLQHVFARSGVPGRSSTARSDGESGAPVDAELLRDGVRVAGPRPRCGRRRRGQDPARDRHSAPALSNRSDSRTTDGAAAWSCAQRRLRGRSRAETERENDETGYGTKGRHDDHRRLVRVDSMSSLVVITLLFIS